MSRTTLNLDPTILHELRQRSHAERKSMGRIASEMLAWAFSHPEAAPGQPFHWASRNLGVPFVDLEAKEAVRAILDASE